ncbi:hypothetical protein [Psychrobacter sp. Pi2-51]|uniref:hypothetical protein n=1 Tax=Psychrobacter sp. Pi2-51 TaxID=2774132 RepID=UPI001919E087|nr:hypothetical protein [Psychrobacter sp. Pi2-51]
MSFSIEILLGLLAVIAAITVPLIIYFLQKSKKRLAYEVVSNTQLVGVKSEVQNKIKIYYENKLVENVHLVSIRIINSGNQPISIDDFARPISIQLGSSTNILTCEVLEQSPKDLDISILKMQNSVEIQPLLLNPNDSFNLNILLSDYREELEVSARVKGVAKVEIYREPPPVLNLILLFIMGLSVSLCLLYVVFKDLVESYFGTNSEILVYIIISPIIIIFTYIISSLIVEIIKSCFVRKVKEINSEKNEE